jgi:hypothetical protein
MPVGRATHRIAFAPQAEADEVDDMWLVVHHQDAGWLLVPFVPTCLDGFTPPLRSPCSHWSHDPATGPPRSMHTQYVSMGSFG